MHNVFKMTPVAGAAGDGGRGSALLVLSQDLV